MTILGIILTRSRQLKLSVLTSCYLPQNLKFFAVLPFIKSAPRRHGYLDNFPSSRFQGDVEKNRKRKSVYGTKYGICALKCNDTGATGKSNGSVSSVSAKKARRTSDSAYSKLFLRSSRHPAFFK